MAGANRHHKLLGWFAQLLWLACFLALTPSAHAADASTAAPMCDPSGASVVAPVPVADAESGEITEWHCALDILELLEGGKKSNDAQRHISAEFKEQLVLLAMAWPPAPVGRRLAAPGSSERCELAGVRRLIERPPRA